MSIRPLSRTDEARAKKIWKICFRDSDAFIEEYFNGIVRYENTLGYYEGRELIADLFMLKFQAKIAGADFETKFLAGCATMPEARKRGLMRELVRNAMLDMRRHGLAVTYLHPFLHDFYRRFGYETVAYVKKGRIIPRPGLENGRTLICSRMDQIPVHGMEAAYCSYIEHYDNAFHRTGGRFSQWLRLLLADGGYAAVSETEEIASYALYYMEDGTADVFELVCLEEKDSGPLLNSIPARTVNYIIPSVNDGDSEEFTMMRILNPVSLLEKVPVCKERFILEIEDDFLGEHYNLKIEKTVGGENKVEETDGKADLSLSIGGLARAAAGAFPAGDKCGEYFPRQTACFFETY